MQLIAFVAFPTGLVAQTLPMAEKGGFVYELMRDEEEEGRLDLSEYEKIVPLGDKYLPKLTEPFNITADYMKSYPDAGVSDGYQVMSLPNSNYKGTCELGLPVLLPPVRHQLKPNLFLKYDSDQEGGNVARGWNIDIPKITLDTLCSSDSVPVYRWDGYLLKPGGARDSVKDFSTIRDGHRHVAYQAVVDANSNKSFWYVTDQDSVYHLFSVVSQKSAADDSILAVTKTGDGKIVEWLETYSENKYGDYIRYVYQGNCLDSIYIGRKKETLPLIKMDIKWEDENKHIGEIKELYLKDFSTADSIPSKENEQYDEVRKYVFKSEIKREDNLLKTITVSHVDGFNPYSYSFEYYDDVDSVQHYREFRDNFFSITSDSLIIDRTGLLKTVHMPLGACATVDYDYVPLPCSERDSVVVFNTESDTLYRYRQDRDTLLHSYFHDKDTVARKYLMKSLWVNDAVSSDGRPSKNLFAYGKPLFHEGLFEGFGNVRTTNLNTAGETFSPYRIIEKEYDTVSNKRLLKLVAVQMSDPDGNLMERKTYRYGKADLWADSLFLGVIDRTLWKDGQSEKWDYEYEIHGNKSCVTKLTHYIDDAEDKVITYTYDFNDKRVKAACLKSGGRDLVKIRYKYDDARNYDRVTSMVQSVNDEETVTTDYKYDKDGNMVARILRGDKDLEYRYLYDRRLNLFVERVEDSHGYRTEYGDFDYFYGKVGRVADMNGQVLVQKFDPMGRMDTVIAPIEVESGQSYSIAYDYGKLNTVVTGDSISNTVVSDSVILNVPSEIYLALTVPDSVKALVVATLYSDKYGKGDFDFCQDMSWAGFDTFNILVDTGSIVIPDCHCDDNVKPHLAQTVRFNALYAGKDKGQHFSAYADGFGRVIQEQEEMEIFHPKDLKDKVKVERLYIAKSLNSYDPFGRKTSESTRSLVGKGTVYVNPSREEAEHWTDSEYDVLDRVTRRVEADGSESMFAYDGGQVESVRNGFSGTSQFSIDGKLLSSSLPTMQVLSYDALDRLTSKKSGSEEVSYDYDMLGRIVKVSNSRKGVTTFSYDQLGNLVGRYNVDSVSYMYDGRLLTDVLYSKFKTNNVHFVYGDVNAPYKRVGRVAMLTDAFGVREFVYGCQGEVTKDIRTVVLPDSTIETYRTSYVYDTWNRLGKLVYPDQEILTYSYNINGLPDTVTGSKSYSYQYGIGATYDEYGQNTYYKSCNGAETKRLYNYPVLKMQQMSVSDKQNKSLFGMKSDADVTSVTVGDSASMKVEEAFNMESRTSTEKLTLAVGQASSSYNRVTSYDDNLRRNHVSCITDILLPYDSEGHWTYKYNDKGLLSYMVGGGANGAKSAFLCSYDQRGNLVKEDQANVGDEQELEDGAVVGGSDTRLFAYDEDDNVLASSDNGYVSTYWYDAFGERSLVTDGGQFDVFVNSVGAAGSSYKPNYTFYVNRYFEKNSEGVYTKHVWLGDERIVSKQGDANSYGSNPAMIERAGSGVEGVKVVYDSLYHVCVRGMGLRYGGVGAMYTSSVRNMGEPTSSNNANVDYGNDNYEDKQFYYHTDRENNAMVVSNLQAEKVEQAFFSRDGVLLHLSHQEGWFTPYIYRGFSFDTVTGLYNKGRVFRNPWIIK